MRLKLAILLLAVACLSGCAGVRGHWSYAFGRLWSNTCGGIVKHGPEFAAGAATSAAEGAVNGAIGDAVNHGEASREQKQRRIDEFFDEDDE